MYQTVHKILKNTDIRTAAVFILYVLTSIGLLVSMPLLAVIWVKFLTPIYVTGFLALCFGLSQAQMALEKTLLFLGNSYRMENIKLSFNKCLKINYQFFESHEGQQLFQKAVANTNSSSAPFSTIHLLIARCIFSLVFISIALVGGFFIKARPFNVSFLICAILTFCINFIFNRYEKNRWLSSRESIIFQNNKLIYLNKISKLNDKAEILQYYDASNFIREKYEQICTNINTIIHKFIKKMQRYTIISNILLFIVQLVLLTLLWKSENKSVFSKTSIIILPSIWQFNKAVSIFSVNFFDLKKALSSIENYYRFLEYDTGAASPKLIEEKIIKVEFEDVQFQYPKGKNFKIEHLNLSINKGEKIGIVGNNGSGKTTLVKLLLNFYTNNFGRIKINNVDVSKIENLHDKIACVFQDDIIVPGSIRENILMGREYNQKKYEQAMKASGLLSLLEKNLWNDNINIPAYYHKDGVDLSSGEKQLLFLTRCIYKDADVMIFDEPSATLDPIAEMNLFEKYNRLVKDKIGLFITHRSSSVKMFDKIIVFKNGSIIEEGSFRELMERNGEYAKMYKEQMSTYV